MTLVKLCGLRSERDMIYAVRSGADMAGMILSPGYRRSVPVPEAARMIGYVPGNVVSVGVFADSPLSDVVKTSELLGLGAVQLHGSEDEDYIESLRGSTGIPVIKSFTISGESDLENAESSCADLVLLDAGKGSGKVFDWSVISLKRKFILAGGLSPENVGKAVSEVRPYAVDTSSGTETDGVKDPVKMAAFVENARKADRTEAGL